MSTIASTGARARQALSEEKTLQIIGAINANHALLAKRAVALQANITELGQTPLFTVEELGSVGASMVLYPLSAFRAMNKAAENAYTTIRRDGHQKNAIDQMQTRDERYDRIGYHDFEQNLDAMFASKK